MPELDSIPYTEEQYDHAFKISTSSNVIKSTRRIMFISSDDPDPLNFRGDHFGGKGSGVLIKTDGKFFYLTAKHVITNAYEKGFELGDEFPNYSPFWITTRTTDKTGTDLKQFMFPSKIWDIGELINTDIEGTDTSDVCLIELTLGAPDYLPDHYIDINSKDDVSRQDQLWGGKYLFIAGYPFSKNEYEYENVEEGFTHGTLFQRFIYMGVYHDYGPYICHDGLKAKLSHEKVTGMSGGAVVGMYRNADEVKLSGILVSHSGGKSRFIPSYVFIDALLNYTKSKSYIVDPATVPREELLDNSEMLTYSDKIREEYFMGLMERLGPMSRAKK